jgi:hypothetical protein
MGDRAERAGADGGELSRADVLLKGARTGAVVLGLGSIGAYAARAMALPSTLPPGDLNVLNYLLPFEYLEFKLYLRILSERNDKGEDMPLNEEQRGFFEELMSQEEEHVAALQAMVAELGGKPIERGNYAYAFRELPTAFFLANEIEGYAVGAFNYAIPKLKSKKARELAATIVQVDARHAAIMRQESKEEPAPFAFDTGVNEQGSVIEIEKFTGPSIYQEQGIE